jgi:hypothetical protein
MYKDLKYCCKTNGPSLYYFFIGGKGRAYIIYEDGTYKCSETSALKIQTPGIHPKETIKYSAQGESLKSTNGPFFCLQ